ncbi:MAG: circadian clock protein KaiC [Elusimicrobia bacterium]|nr:circadian clock protein KaiC [Candidatus Obscuribacterium magneticum]
MNSNGMHIKKLMTGIPGFDQITNGGMPKNRTTLVVGTAGSAKTVLAAQFLAGGISKGDENGVFVTFEETPLNICRNMSGFGWDIKKWEAENKWAFVDASQEMEHDTVVTGNYDFGSLLARIEHAVKKVDAKRVSLDSLGTIFTRFADASIVRRELFRVANALRDMDVTALITAERVQEYGDISRHGVEEFVADNVIILRNVLADEKRRRTMEILKFRGTDHQKGEFPFTVVTGKGIILIPLSAMELAQHSSQTRVSSGNIELDKMCGGGFFRDSIILISGATGAGKTLVVTEFVSGGVKNNERTLLFAFEESPAQLSRNAIGWGVDFEALEKKGSLKIICAYPETAGLEDHLIRIKAEIEEFKPNRIVLESLSALGRISSFKSFREFVIALTSFIKEKEIVGLFTSTTAAFTGGASTTESHISTITDSIILLRYVEIFGEMRRCITVLKMRGSSHDKDIREYTIDGQGMHIGKPLRNVTGILGGTPTYLSPQEQERVGDLFKEVTG